MKVVGNYHDMGAFAADVGALPRIVTLNDVRINAHKDGSLAMEATARTFRYLDEEEIAVITSYSIHYTKLYEIETVRVIA